MDMYESRVQKVQKVMGGEGFNYLLLGPSANMFYFSGLKTSPDERLQLLIIPSEGEPFALLPEMYKEKAMEVLGRDYKISTWSDETDPFDMTAGLLKAGSPLKVAIDDTLRADHLIGIGKVLSSPLYEPAALLIDRLRAYKDASEIELMHEAGKIADQVMEIIKDKLRPGLSEKEVALMVEMEYRSLADDISFKPIVASGPNAAQPHHSPGERQLQSGDLVIIDSGALYKGYCSDITRTFCLGEAAEEMKKVYRAVLEANQAAFEALQRKGSLSGAEADAISRKVITDAGYGTFFIHRLGHGIGLEVHEAPYLVDGNDEPLTQGMAFTIEPGIYLPGKFGVRIEDTVVLTVEGPLSLTAFNRELIEI